MKLFNAVLLIFLTFAAASAQVSAGSDPGSARIVTSDIQLFWNAYDKATPANDLVVYRDEYLKKGSEGLKQFTHYRIENSCALVDAIAKAPKYYAALREPSLRVADHEPRIRASFQKLKDIYPAAVFPDVYFLMGKMNSAGTLSATGLLIGVDMFGKNAGAPLDELGAWHTAVVSSMDRLPYIVAHELIHYQQKNAKDTTLLARSLNEGIPDLIGEMISGGTINPHLHKYGDPIEERLWLEFKSEMNGTDSTNWLYQGDKAKDKPADLGYYIGYKIAASYYNKAADKDQAISDLLNIKDFKRFLAESGYENKFTGESK